MSTVPAKTSHTYVPPERGTWSSSLLQQYQRCPLAWWMTTNSGHRTGLAPVHWRRGSVAHAGMEAAYNARIAWGDRFGVGSMEFFYDAAEDAMVEAWEELHMPDDPAMFDGVREHVRLVLAKLPAPRLANLVGVEAELHGMIDGRIKVRSFLDLVLRPAPDWVHVRDWKTFTALPSEQELRDGIQLPLYAWMAKQAYPWARRVSVSIYSIPANAERFVELTDGDLDRLVERVIGIVDAAEADEVCQPVPSEWCDTCWVKPDCPVWNPESTLAHGMDRDLLGDMRSAMDAIDGF
jgi:hypothetical protein